MSEWHAWRPAGRPNYNNERQPYYQQQPHPYHQQPYEQQAPRQFVPEDTLKSVDLQVERKFYRLMLKDNPRGRFLRITEGVAGRRNAIIVPAAGLLEFQKLLAEMVKADAEIQAKNPTPPPAPPESGA